MKTTAILFLMATLLNIYYFSITVNTQRYLKSEINRIQPEIITEVKETTKIVETECPVCLWEDTPAE